MSLLNGKIGLALCFAFLVIFSVRILDGLTKEGLPKAKTSAYSASTPATELTPKRDVGTTNALVIKADRQGHFNADALINGTDLNFLIDTGATIIALRESDAKQAGIRVREADFTLPVSTANGNVFGASIELRRVEISDLYVQNVNAIVLPDAALARNLMGMNLLAEFGRIEFDSKEIRLFAKAQPSQVLAKKDTPRKNRKTDSRDKPEVGEQTEEYDRFDEAPKKKSKKDD